MTTSSESGAGTVPAAPPVAAAGDRPPDLLSSPDAGGAAIRGGGLRALGFAGGLLLTLGSAPLVFRHLGVVNFGRYMTVLSLVTIATGLSEGGLNAVALREYATRSGPERRSVLANIVGLRIGLTFAAVGAAVVFAVASGYDAPLLAGTAIAGAGMFLQVLATLLATGLQGELRFGWATAAELGRNAALVVALVALVLAGAGLVPLLAAQIPAGLAALAIVVPAVRGRIPLRARFERAVWWPLMKDTLPYALSIAVYILYFRLAIIFMSLVSSGRQTGYFATSFRIMEVLVGIPPVVIAAAFPLLARSARDDPERFAYGVRRIFEVALIAGTWIAVCLEIGAGLAIKLLAGHKFDPAIPVLRLQAPAIIATFLAVAATYPLLSLSANRRVLVANVLALSTSVALLAILVPPHGAKGAAVATVAAEFALGLGSMAMLERARRGVGLPLRSLLAVGAAAGVALCALLVPVPASVQLVIGTLAFAAVLQALGRLPWDVVQAVMRR